MKRCFLRTLLTLAFVSRAAHAQSTGDLEIVPAPSLQKYCHVVRFPQGWIFQRFDQVGQRITFDSNSGGYEFRVTGLLSAEFLVAGLVELPERYYTLNRYKVNLSDPGTTVVPADRNAWDAAAVVPLSRKSGSPAWPSPPEGKPYAFHGFHFPKRGEVWAQPSDQATLLSPDQRWLVLLSRARDKDTGPTRVFLDVFNADNGNKILDIDGTYSSSFSADPDGTLTRAAWLTERYFLVPLGTHKERCLVCEFSRNPDRKAARP